MVGRAYDECAEGSWGEFHEVDGYHAPCALDAKLFEKGCGHDSLVAYEGVGIEKKTADEGNDNDTEATTEDL